MSFDSVSPVLGGEVLVALEAVWGIHPTTITRLHGELDTTARIDAGGSTFVVKVRDVDAVASVDLELAVLQRLADAGVPASRIVPTVAGLDRALVGGTHVWVLEWMAGTLLADVRYRTPTLLNDLGRIAANIAEALRTLDHPEAQRTHHWDLRHADRSLRLHLDQVAGERRTIIERALDSFSERVRPRLDALPVGLVHQDLNDHNVLVSGRAGERRVSGVLDPGDALYSVGVSELAVAIAYAMLRTHDPLRAAADVVAGWVEISPLVPDEVDCVFPMAVARLGVNATTWADRRARGQVEYADARSGHTWAALERLDLIDPDYATMMLRTVAGLGPAPEIASASLATQERSASAALPSNVASMLATCDLDPHRDVFDAVDPTDAVAVALAVAGDRSCFRPHLSVRLERGGRADGSGGPATVQLGVEVLLAEPVTIAVPVDGRVVARAEDRLSIEHRSESDRFWSIWGGLESIPPGDDLTAGSQLGTSTDFTVRLSLIDPVGHRQLPSFVRPSDQDAWAVLSPDPAAFLGLVANTPSRWMSADEVMALREERLAHSQRSYYQRPMNLVRASGTWLIDDQAHHYLDAINNVTHVGHGHPQVVEAATRQMRRLNTNSRFVYEEMASYADRLAATLPDPLEVVFLVCTGSEANDLAMRISRQVTGRDDIIIIDGAYHGNTTAVTGISPNRYKGPGGAGPPATTHEVMQPNPYRGSFAGSEDAGHQYANDVEAVVARLLSEGRPPAAFIAESLMGTAGQIVHPAGYLAESFAHVRAAGGLCISDEVQVGFGRLGHRFWGFELAGVVPDIVTMGKPMGNGHPIAAVVTTRQIADTFDIGMKYFNTFGGNPVSCAVAGAVLDVIEQEHLQEQALHVGARFRDRLTALVGRHACIGDIRGEGFYLGVELVHDRSTKEPAAALTAEISERMRERGVIVYPNGDLGNVLKIKPPMVFSESDVDVFVLQLDATLAELG